MRDKLHNYCQIPEKGTTTWLNSQKRYKIKNANGVKNTGSGFRNGWLSRGIPRCNFKCHFPHQLITENKANKSRLCVLTSHLAFLISLLYKPKTFRWTPISYIYTQFSSWVPSHQPPPLVLSVFPGCPPLFPFLGLFIWVAVTTPPTPHTQTRGMYFRQGANGKINYQQPKSPGAALLLHFWERKEGAGKSEG